MQKAWPWLRGNKEKQKYIVHDWELKKTITDMRQRIIKDCFMNFGVNNLKNEENKLFNIKKTKINSRRCRPIKKANYSKSWQSN